MGALGCADGHDAGAVVLDLLPGDAAEGDCSVVDEEADGFPGHLYSIPRCVGFVVDLPLRNAPQPLMDCVTEEAGCPSDPACVEDTLLMYGDEGYVGRSRDTEGD